MPDPVYVVIFDAPLEDDDVKEIKDAFGGSDHVYQHSDRLLFVSIDDLAGSVKEKAKIKSGERAGIIIQMTSKYTGYTNVTLWEWLAARLRA